jgi:replication factor C subunit 3/5
MELLIDKYAIKTKEDVVFNKDIYDRLIGTIPTPQKLLQDREYFKNSVHLPMKDAVQQFLMNYRAQKIYKYSMIGNLLIHGFNKTALVNILLYELYGPDVRNVRTIPYDIESYNAKEKIVDIQQSQYHIVIEANGTGLDKIIIQEIIKNYVTTRFFKTEQTMVPFKIVLIKNADKLSTYAQASLRRTMECYYDSCRFILCASETSKIIGPLRSRCSNIRLPKPSNNELITFIACVAKKENIIITIPHVRHIVSKSNRDVKTCLWWLQHYIYNICDYSESWKLHLKKITSILDFIHRKKTVIKITGLITLRSTINGLLLTNIPCRQIMKEFLFQLIGENPEYGYELHKKIIDIFYKYEQRLATGTRHIIHIEALFIELCKTMYETDRLMPSRSGGVTTTIVAAPIKVKVAGVTVATAKVTSKKKK